MVFFVMRRLAALIVLLLIIALCAFALVRIAPGDYLSELASNPQINPETIEHLRVRYGLDLPWYTQFVRWLGRALRGDLGYSLDCQCEVAPLIGKHIFKTALLAVVGLTLALVAAFSLGVAAARLRSRLLDRALDTLAAVLLAWPTFLWALGGILLAAVTGWFPIGGVESPDYESFSTTQKIIDLLHHLALPALVIALKQMPHYLQMLRVSLVEAMAEEHITAARARGMGETRLLLKHGLRNAMNPMLTMIGQGAGALLSGTFVVEAVMSWPGIGSLAVRSLLARDLDPVVASLLLAAILLALANLAADLLLAAADPRIRRPQRS
jgi:peptide/nickel transport system permease protein